MKKFSISMTAVLAVALVSALAFAGDKGDKSKKMAGPKPGDVAPTFTAMDQNGSSVDLGALKGKIVVLEWFNNECPYVVKHYQGGHMNQLASAYADKGVVWLAVNSTSGKTADDMKIVAADWKIDRPILLDSSGQIGKSYGSRNTPTMYIIDKEGVLVYRGAIDSKPDPDTGSIANAKNYVAMALDELLAGKPVSEPETKAYGCSVKYGK